MAKNRKNQSGAVRFVPALKAVLLCSIIGFFCVGYVWQKNKIYELGQQIGVRQVKLERLKKDNQDLASTLATLQRPMYLSRRANDLKLGLAPPTQQQIVWIAEPAPQPLTTNLPPFQFVQSAP